MSLQPSSEESTWIKPKELEHVVFNAPTKEELGKIENTFHATHIQRRDWREHNWQYFVKILKFQAQQLNCRIQGCKRNEENKSKTPAQK